MLLPISHEKMTVRRLPLVTIVLIGACFVAFLMTSVAGDDASLRLAYVPSHSNFLGLFTYMFAHADVWHLTGNMWFLFLCGLSLEDRWGRLAFAIYYLVAGVVAAGVHHLATSDPSAALIGASGAVAGAMGAFLVLFATTKIQFIGFLGLRPTTFSAPAYVMLPLWAAIEVLYGLITSAVGGTAHWAHVGGFVFGVVRGRALPDLRGRSPARRCRRARGRPRRRSADRCGAHARRQGRSGPSGRAARRAREGEAREQARPARAAREARAGGARADGLKALK